jgi:hypothetical protein
MRLRNEGDKCMKGIKETKKDGEKLRYEKNSVEFQ